jgi:hypothetical protein
MKQGMAPGTPAWALRTVILCAAMALPRLPALSQAVLSEIMFDPSGSENTDEFVELFNAGEADTVDLRGWRLGDGTGDDGLADTGGGFSLIPGQYAVILDPDYFGQSASYDSLIPSGALVLTIDGNTFGSGGFSNTKGETVVIFDATGKSADQCAYRTGGRPGYSVERVDPCVPGEQEDNWVESKTPLGTPGFRNSAAKVERNLEIVRIFAEESPPGALLSAVVSNSGKSAVCDFEVRFTDGPDSGAFPDEPEEIGRAGHDENLLPGDSTVISLYQGPSPGVHRICARVVLSGDGKPEDDTLCRRVCFGYPRNSLIINEIMYNPVSGEGEWIEIFNPQSADISLVDWSVSDQDSARKAKASISFGRIQAGGFYVLASDSSLYWIFPGLSDKYQALPGFPILNNDSDSVVLYDPSGKRIDGVNYCSRWGGLKGISLERIDWRRESDHANNWHASISNRGCTPCEYNSLAPIDPADEGFIDVQPNPFSPEADGSGQVTAISCHLPFESSYIHLRIFDSRGRVIRHFERGGLCGKVGIYAWDGRDDLGQPMPVGQYIVLLEASEQNGGRTVIGRSVVVLARKL